MSSEEADGPAVPRGAAFVASRSGQVYHWVGSRAWRYISPLNRVWFADETSALAAGYRPSAAGFERLDEFEILGELGRGGTSIVYHARDRVLGRDVAIKVIQAPFEDDSETLERFTQEARLLAGLRHPNIVSALSVKQLHGGGLALVMEHVAGRTLRDLIVREAPLRVEQVEQILRDIAAALAAAHAHGVVHRDVKPDNVFIEATSGRALLADFGIAVRLDSGPRLTRAGSAIGTPTYMSPERIDGVTVDGRSDLYSLALIGWEMLTGETPWEGETLYSVIYKQKHEQLPSLRVRRPDAPRELRLAIEGALAKDPEARWASAEVFLARLSEAAPEGWWRRGAAALDLPAMGWWAGSDRRAAARGPAPMQPPVAQVSERLDAGDAAAGAAALTEVQTVLFRRGQSAPAPLPVPALPGELVAEPAERPATPRRQRWARPALAAAVVVAALGASLATLRQPVASPAPAGREPVLSQQAALRVQPVGVASVAAGGAGDTAFVAVADTLAEPAASPVPDSVAALPPASADTAVRDTAPPPAPLLPVERTRSRLAVGGMHTCQLDPRGGLLCWGGNERGQLGAGEERRASAPLAPTGVAGRFRAVVAGGFHTCALGADGTAQCWGENGDGQLGAGAAGSTAPRRVGATRFSALALGMAHSCGIGENERAYCWGSNAHGQIGVAGASRATPARLDVGEPLASVAAGWYHSCALTRTGRVLCWGQNSRGQLGDGSTSDRAVPTAARTEARFGSLVAGSAHTCALTTEGEAYCWGQNSDGRVGDGSSADRAAPTPVRTQQRFSELSAGGRHTCGLTSNGTAFCWGQNNYGQLGTGDSEGRSTPTRVRTDLRFTALRSSGAHTCGMTAGGAAYCWGFNIEGQLGDGTQTHATTPRRVARPASNAS